MTDNNTTTLPLPEQSLVERDMPDHTELARRMEEAAKIVRDCWQDLLDKDDRTSPAEYPDMCLITRDELADYMNSAAEAERSARIAAEELAQGILGTARTYEARATSAEAALKPFAEAAGDVLNGTNGAQSVGLYYQAADDTTRILVPGPTIDDFLRARSTLAALKPTEAAK